MKTSRYKQFIFVLIFGSAISAQAEDSIVHRNVTVEREYKPVIKDAGKINSIPEVLETRVEKTAPNYSNFNLPLNADFNIHTLEAAELKSQNRTESKSGFARIGLGNYFNTLADFAYPIISKPDMQLDFRLNHTANFGKEVHSITKSSIQFDKNFSTFNLYTGVSGGHEYFKYYGNNFNSDTVINLKSLTGINNTSYTETNRSGLNTFPHTLSLKNLANDSVNNTFWRFNAYMGVRSLPLSTGIRYQAELKYNLLNTGYGFTEHQVNTHGGLSAPIGKNRVGLDFNLNNLVYKSTNSNSLNFWNAYSVLTLKPYYSIERENWNVRLGLKSNISFEPGGTGLFTSPDVFGEWRIIPKYISIYGGLIGDYKVNTLNDVCNENRFLFSEIRVKDTYTPYNFYAGFKVKPLYNLFLDAYIDYRQIDNQYFFVNKGYFSTSPALIGNPNYLLYTNRFDVIYSNASLTKIGFRASYNLHDLANIELKGAYNGWNVKSEAQAWNKPKWEAELNTDIHINSNLSINMNTNFEGIRYAKLGTNLPIRMRPKVDINLGANYLFNNWLTAFVKVNNLINNPYEEFYGYKVQGFNVMVGAAFSF